MADSNETREILTDVVEGRRDWTALRDLGYSIEFHAHGHTFNYPAGAVEIDPTIHQVATGFVASIERGNLRRWAEVLISGPFGFDFSDTPDGERLKELIWDATCGESPGAADMAFVAELADRRDAE